MAFVNAVAGGVRSRSGRRGVCAVKMGMDVAPREFKDNLSQLPSVDGVSVLELFAIGSQARRRQDLDARIYNQEGQIGSLKVYVALLKKYKAIDNQAAEEGLRLYAEKVAEADENPGKHPNIDRLKEVIATNVTLIGKVDGKYIS
mmetsp:Transcript_9602/g.29054  ORF Transcript_9602/g.29054 Transcript_9602/m.29054 type:complete len:145 (+) Transcript_9602:118-552(+)